MKINDLTTAELTAGAERTLDVVTLDDGDVFKALSSATAQRIVTTLEESPCAASEIAAEIDASIQTVAYHLDHLEEVGLIAPVATAYSEKGREMDIYALTTREFVIRFRDDPHQPTPHGES